MKKLFAYNDAPAGSAICHCPQCGSNKLDGFTHKKEKLQLFLYREVVVCLNCDFIFNIYDSRLKLA